MFSRHPSLFLCKAVPAARQALSCGRVKPASSAPAPRPPARPPGVPQPLTEKRLFFCKNNTVPPILPIQETAPDGKKGCFFAKTTQSPTAGRQPLTRKKGCFFQKQRSPATAGRQPLTGKKCCFFAKTTQSRPSSLYRRRPLTGKKGGGVPDRRPHGRDFPLKIG